MAKIKIPNYVMEGWLIPEPEYIYEMIMRYRIYRYP